MTTPQEPKPPEPVAHKTLPQSLHGDPQVRIPLVTRESALAYAEALAAARVAQERERCANLCEDLGGDNRWSDAHGCAHAIRQNPPETGKEPRA